MEEGIGHDRPAGAGLAGVPLLLLSQFDVRLAERRAMWALSASSRWDHRGYLRRRSSIDVGLCDGDGEATDGGAED